MKLNKRCILRFSVTVKDLTDSSGQHTKINFPPAVLLLVTQPSVSSSFLDHVYTQATTNPIRASWDSGHLCLLEKDWSVTLCTSNTFNKKKSAITGSNSILQSHLCFQKLSHRKQSVITLFVSCFVLGVAATLLPAHSLCPVALPCPACC